MLSPKENYRQIFLHKPVEYTPCTLTDGAIFGFGAKNGPWFEKAQRAVATTDSVSAGSPLTRAIMQPSPLPVNSFSMTLPNGKR